MKPPSKTRIQRLLRRAGQFRILVIGDVMLDHYIHGTVTRISPEAPVPVVKMEREVFAPGGAGNVAMNLASLGAEVEIEGDIGRNGCDGVPDVYGCILDGILKDSGIGVQGLDTCLTVTTRKCRIIAGGHHLLRMDEERLVTGKPLHRRLWFSDPEKFHAVIISDYAKGVVTLPLVESALETCHKNKVWLSLAPKPKNLDTVSLGPGKGRFSLVSMNRDEDAENATAFMTSNSLVTKGPEGMELSSEKARFQCGSYATKVVDVSGAGDTVLAVFTLASLCGATPFEAMHIASRAAAVVVGKMGTATATLEEICKV